MNQSSPHDPMTSLSLATRRAWLVPSGRQWLQMVGLLVILIGSVWGVGCGAPVTKVKDFCQDQGDCAPGQDCLNTICVSKNTDGGLPWGEVPSHVDASAEPNPDATPDANPDTNPDATPDTITGCQRGDQRTCSTGKLGACQEGVQECTDGLWGKCEDKNGPTEEICNNKDDNCDGKVDETFAGSDEPCDSGNPGICRLGKKVCKEGTITCEQSAQPIPESCNNKDDDCDGKVDNIVDAGQICKIQGKLGPCAEGKLGCEKGAKTCLQIYKPVDEKCDEIDNNCDGQVDETCDCRPGLTRPCYSGNTGCRRPDPKGVHQCVLPCKTGTQFCSLKGKWGLCANDITPAPEVCDNQDNDCDGIIDNNVTPQKCKTDCGEGIKTCSLGKWSACSARLPTPEICDGKDNDCDGKTDEGNPGGGGSCVTNQQGPCAKGTNVCANGTIVCKSLTQPTVETCNNIDDNCSGQIDEGVTQACYTGPPGTRKNGICQDGVQTCKEGHFGQCERQVLPKKETCNGIDDDCDGKTDNKLPPIHCVSPANTTCVAATVGSAAPYKCTGACQSGTRTCSNGGWTACTGEVTPSGETCNQKDDDCDGFIDEDCGGFQQYAIVAANGTSPNKQGFTSTNATAQGRPEYLLVPGTGSNQPNCRNRALILTAQSNQAAAATYLCQPSTAQGYRVFTHQEAAGGTRMGPAQVPFHAVVPSTGLYGRISCDPRVAGKKCKMDFSNGNLSVSYAHDANIAIIKFQHVLCNNPNQPIFATIFGNQAGYVHTLNVSGGYCEFQTFDADGTPALRDFSFWLPLLDKGPWAATQRAGGVVDQTSTYNPTIASRWLTIHKYNTNSMFTHTEANYPALSNPTLILLTPRFSGFTSLKRGFTASFLPPTGGRTFQMYHFSKPNKSAAHSATAPPMGVFIHAVRTK